MTRNAALNLRALAAVAAAILLATPAAAYYHYVHFLAGPSSSAVYEKYDLSALMDKTVSVHVDDSGPQTKGNDSFNSVLSQLKDAAAVWNSVAASDLRVAFGGLQAPKQASATPGIEVQFAQMPPGVLAEAAPTVAVDPVTGPDGQNFFPIVGSVMLMNSDASLPPGPSYAETYFTTAVHEMGHALGLQHTFTSSAMSQAVVRNTSRTSPLGADDQAALAVLYGKDGWRDSFGSISGQVTANKIGVALASVVALPAVGPAVSALTNPDGTFTIDGIPPGQYVLYVHPLPPDADVTLPKDVSGNAIAAGAAFGTVFFGPGGAGTLDPSQASPVTVAASIPVTNQNVAVSPRASVPVYDLVTFSYFDSANQTYSYVGSAVTPAFINSTQAATKGVATVVVWQSTPGAATPVPQSATLLGGIGSAQAPVSCCAPQAVALYFDMPAGAAPGPRHLVLNFGSDMYVLPNAVVVTQQNPPALGPVTANQDGSATVSGAGLAAGSRIFFDGLETAVRTGFSGDASSGSMTVVPPPGSSSQVASVVAYNPDGQSSMTLDSWALATGAALPNPPPTYAYPAAGQPSIGITPASAAAGVSSRVDLTVSNMNLVNGQVTIGFGSSDIAVRKLWVAGPTHLVANVVVSPGASLASSEISVISGFQVASLANAFQSLPANPAMPSVDNVTNGFLNQATIYAGGYGSLFGTNLAQSASSPQLALNGERALIVYATNDMINFLVPSDAPQEIVNLVLNNGVGVSPPLAVNISPRPPVILAIARASGGPLDATHPAAAGDVLNVVVGGLDPTAVGDATRVSVTLDGVPMPIQQFVPQGSGATLIQVLLTNPPTGDQVALAVETDGSSGRPVPIPVTSAH